MTDRAGREALVAAGHRLVAMGLSAGSSGNLSLRTGNGLLITPTGIPYEAIGPGDIVPLLQDGTPAPGAGSPSSEWRIHRDIYAARPDAAAVVHAHPPHATAIACLRRDIPAAHYMVAVAGGASIRCAEYATFGTAELSANTLAALVGRRACLLANHGIVTLGSDLTRALSLADDVERLAEVYGLALAAGTPVILDEAEMSRVVKLFRSYRT